MSSVLDGIDRSNNGTHGARGGGIDLNGVASKSHTELLLTSQMMQAVREMEDTALIVARNRNIN